MPKEATAMLERIRAALGRKVTEAPESRLTTLPPARLEGVMPPIAPADRLAKFEAELTAVSGCPHRAPSPAALESILTEILRGCESKSVVLTRNPLLHRLQLAASLRANGVHVDEWPASSAAAAGDPSDYREACFAAAVGISGVDCALAETGSLVLSSETEGSQLASLAPPIHVALYRREQLVSSLDDALELLAPRAAATAAAQGAPDSQTPAASPKPAAGRSLVFITGTSRTADIEQVLIRGVHGPRDLHAILIEESCLDR